MQAHLHEPSGCLRTGPLQNVVATVNLECKLDLKNIALHARNAEYNPKVGAALHCCCCCCCLLLLCLLLLVCLLFLPTAAVQPEQQHPGMEYLNDIAAANAHSSCSFAAVLHTRLSGTAPLPHNCHLQRFAAVIMRIREPKSTALIFHSGVCACSGPLEGCWVGLPPGRLAIHHGMCAQRPHQREQSGRAAQAAVAAAHGSRLAPCFGSPTEGVPLLPACRQDGVHGHQE